MLGGLIQTGNKGISIPKPKFVCEKNTIVEGKMGHLGWGVPVAWLARAAAGHVCARPGCARAAPKLPSQTYRSGTSVFAFLLLCVSSSLNGGLTSCLETKHVAQLCEEKAFSEV